jgi:predicted house-cleaning noncanonical NTP pyrophosphatase (MazG superfamily)
MKYRKLVRDGIPGIIRARGAEPVVRKLAKTEFKTLLREKLVEEAQEFLNAKSREEAAEELADVQEVLRALYDAEGISSADVGKVRRQKHKKRGGFAKRIFLEEVKE